MQITHMRVDELRPNPNNARVHPRRQIRQIAKAIKEFGFNNPVLIDDRNVILAGHGRVEAAKLLGLETVPTCRLSHLSDTEKRAYVLADNKLALAAGWDKEILAIELQGLIELEVDVELTGFEMGEIDVLLEEARDARTAADDADDRVPQVAPNQPVTQLGDVWTLGAHRLLCGDARDPTAYSNLMQDEKAEFVFTDPPFNVRIGGNVSGLGRVKHREFPMATGEMTEAEFTSFLEEVFKRLVENTIDGSIHQVCIDWRHLGEMLAAGRKSFGSLKNLCVWAKTTAGMGTFYRSQHELVFVWKAGTAPHLNNFELGQHGRNRTNLWCYPGANSPRAGRLEELAMHPTTKPVALVGDAIMDCSRRGGLVLDPFCGSGTILIAAERTGRKARAMELDPLYVDVAVRRWQTYTGKCAYLAESGEAFETIEEQHRIPPKVA